MRPTADRSARFAASWREPRSTREPLTILYATPSGELGGVERFLDGLLEHHDRARVRPILLAGRDGSWIESLRERGHHATVLPGAHLRNIVAFTRALHGLLKRERVRLVHSAFAWTHALTAPAAHLARVPQVWFEHGPVWSDRWRGVTSLFPTRAILVNSSWTLRAVRRSIHVASSYHVVPLSVDVDRLRPDAVARARFRARWSVTDDDVCVGIVGFLDPYKGQHVFLEAAQQVLARGQRAVFFLVGGPRAGAAAEYCAPYIARLHAMVAELGIESHVRFTGHVDVLDGALDGLDVVVNASVNPEPFGMTIIEAMAKGRPVIGPAEAGPKENISDGADGLLVPPGDVPALAQAMARLAGDPALRARMGVAGRRKAEERFHPRCSARQLEALYEEITGRRRTVDR